MKKAQLAPMVRAALIILGVVAFIMWMILRTNRNEREPEPFFASPQYEMLPCHAAPDRGDTTPPDTASERATAPYGRPSPTGDIIQFVIITDIHLGAQTTAAVTQTNGKVVRNVTEVMQAAAALDSGFVVNLGDLTRRDGNAQDFEFYKRATQALYAGMVVYPGLGNHDGWRLTSPAVRHAHDYITQNRALVDDVPDTAGAMNVVYSFILKGVLFIHLAWGTPGSDARIDANVLVFLSSVLNRHPRDIPIVVFQHFPPAPDLWNLLWDKNVVAIFYGHEHGAFQRAPWRQPAGAQARTLPPIQLYKCVALERGFLQVNVQGVTGRITVTRRERDNAGQLQQISM